MMKKKCKKKSDIQNWFDQLQVLIASINHLFGIIGSICKYVLLGQSFLIFALLQKNQDQKPFRPVLSQNTLIIYD